MADTRITINAQLQMRHDIEDNWKAVDPVLRPGEPAYTIEYDDRFKIGDGQRRWSELPYLTMHKGGAEGTPPEYATEEWVKEYSESKFFSQAQFDPAKTHDYVKSYVNYDDEAPKTLELGVDLIIQDDIANAAEDDLDNGIFRNGLVTALGVRKYVQQKDSYTHIQGEASDTWTIEHNMGRYPSVTVVDSAGSAVFGDVTYTNENQLTVTFSVAFSGKAYLN